MTLPVPLNLSVNFLLLFVLVSFEFLLQSFLLVAVRRMNVLVDWKVCVDFGAKPIQLTVFELRWIRLRSVCMGQLPSKIMIRSFSTLCSQNCTYERELSRTRSATMIISVGCVLRKLGKNKCADSQCHVVDWRHKNGYIFLSTWILWRSLALWIWWLGL